MQLSAKRFSVIMGVLAVPPLILASYVAFVILNMTDWREHLGTFGDSFGVINALFTGLAFSGLLITIIQQREEIALQHRELVESRRQFERSATAQEQTAKLNAYTSLLNAYNAQIEAMAAANRAYMEQRSKALAGNSLDRIAEAMLAKSPYSNQVERLAARKAQIVGELEQFLAPLTSAKGTG